MTKHKKPDSGIHLQSRVTFRDIRTQIGISGLNIASLKCLKEPKNLESSNFY